MTSPVAPKTENEQGQPYCTQPWCASRNLASVWLLDTNDGRTWHPCCTYCRNTWANRGCTAENGGLIEQPMYITEDAPEPVVTPEPAAAVQEAPKGFWATYKAWRRANRTEAALVEGAAGLAAWGALHHSVEVSQQRNLDSINHVTPRNNVQAGMWRQQAREAQARASRQQDQTPASQPQQAYGRQTKRSDIYGNLL